MNTIFSVLFHWTNQLILYYVLVVDGFYMTLFLLSFQQIKEYMKRNTYKTYKDMNTSQLTPPISLLVPAFNEERTIQESLISFLMIEYPEYEVIVINDGSTDKTLQTLIETFSLHEMNYPIRNQIQTQRVKRIYRSVKHPQLVVLDKENGGKADALNAGVNVSSYPYICSVDADSLLERDALLKTVQPFKEGEEDIVACGGIVRIANGCRIENGRIVEVGLSKNPIVIHQTIEYLRSFLMGRVGFTGINSLLIISGAFGIFRKKEIIEIGGYDTQTVGEDMEIVIRLQKYLYEKKSKSKVLFLPNPICWTEAPSSLRVLARQRIRWHLGLFQSLVKHKDTLFNPKYKVMGLLTIPYFVIVELLGPTIEIFGTILMLIGLYLDIVNIPFAIIFILATFVFGMFLSISAVLLEEMSFRKYTRIRDFLKLLMYSVLESLWYRQLNAFWRTIAFFKYPVKQRSWGNMERKGFSNDNN
ncbi:glycosyltransferase family 2 protein [Bacillus solimangrovi]|uniref:glycosyltransferase family 2 protein n=1 Tax=Bacillus solimangrovi TaxID=1305675 RepID=UPI0009F544E4|nr:glycosyltransferase [Bacillus solimangrovi]